MKQVKVKILIANPLIPGPSSDINVRFGLLWSQKDMFDLMETLLGSDVGLRS